MIPLDPKKAQKVGEEWGKVAADSVFGIVDVLDKHKKDMAHVKAVNEANKGAIEHNKKVNEQQKILKEIAMAEEAKAQETAMLQAMSPAQREAYHKAKIAAAKAKAKQELKEANARAETEELLQALSLVFIGIPLVLYFLAFMMVTIFAYSDRSSYRMIAPYVPFAQTVYGKY